jgi:hypothetical protein
MHYLPIGRAKGVVIIYGGGGLVNGRGENEVVPL